MKRMIGALALSAMTFAGMAHADIAIPKALNMPLQNGMKIDKSFPAAAGLTGWVISPADKSKGGQSSIVYTSADGNYLIAGLLVDSTGVNLTAQYTDAQIPKVDLSGMLAKLEKSAYVIEGAKNPKQIVYVFSDPNCPFCDLTWKALQPYEAEGLQVRWIQVAFLRPDSAGKAAALLQAKDAEAAMKANELNFNFPDEEGGIAPVQVSSQMQAALNANAELMREFGFTGTPAMVYKSPTTGQVVAKPGMPRPSTLGDEFGLPAVPVTDPMLARFH
jgi:thiol:disulfide interchange protein DsbG